MASWQDELGELMAVRGNALVRYAYLLCGDRGLAEDLVQDALVKVFSRLRGPGRAPGAAAGAVAHDLEAAGVTNAEAYVRRAILTLYLDGYRRRQRFSGLRHVLAADVGPAPSAEGPASARVDVTAALARLGPRLRACAVLRYYEDLTVPQIAGALGIAEGTAKRYLSEATASLHESLRLRDAGPGRTPHPPSEGRTAR